MESSSSSSERPQTSELFICFTSRLSSSMKISSSSKPSTSILSPGRQISLSSSLSRRLRSSGSLKGAASPMFPGGGAAVKKRSGCGAAFDTPEPSSPKVTCIGQVRVKTKMQAGKSKSKKKKKISRSRSSSSMQLRRTMTAGEASFRRAATEQESENSTGGFNNGADTRNANRYWVHQLPVTICEALREFNCFLPCRSSCAKDGERKRSPEESAARSGGGDGGGGNGGRSCGAVFARWLVAVQDGDGKGREIELVVGEEEEVAAAAEVEKEVRSGSQRRRVFEGIEFKDLEAMVAREEGVNGGKEEAARVSLCVPPKNALLLMRCRSDPVKMAALASRFWESPAPKKGDGDNGEEEDEDDREEDVCEVGDVVEKIEKCLDVNEEEEEEESLVVVEEEDKASEDGGLEQEYSDAMEKEDVDDEEVERENLDVMLQSVTETVADGDIINVEEEENENENDQNEVELLKEDEHDCDSLSVDKQELVEEKEETEKDVGPENVCPEKSEQQEPLKETQDKEEEEENAETEVKLDQQEEKENAETETEVKVEEEEETQRESEPVKTGPEDPNPKVEIRESQSQGPAVLPDCLLLMMCEPKLSMEVSKETWVCSTDFIRCLPERRRPPLNNPKQPEKNRRSAPPKPPAVGDPSPAVQPPRSSCSFPTMANVVEHKLAPYEPFVLTRCKSEPMRSAAKLAAVAAAPPPPPPEASSCFWKNRKLEPHHHRPPTVGAAGVGF